MKSEKFLLALAALGTLSLVGCNPSNSASGSSTSSSSVPATPSYKISNIGVTVKDDLTYGVTFKTDKAVNESVSYYISTNNKYDSSDTAITPSIDGTSYSFDYDLDLVDFYVLIVAQSDGTVYGRATVSIPAFDLKVSTGEGTDEGKDVLAVSFLANGVSPDTFIDPETTVIYRQDSVDLDKTTAEKVVEGQTLADKSVFKADASQGKDYYFVETSLNGGLSTFTSQAFKKDVAFGSDLVSVSQASIATDGKLTVKGTVEGSQAHTKLAVTASGDAELPAVAITPTDGSFETVFDLSALSLAATDYSVCIKFGAGLFTGISSSVIPSDFVRAITTDRIYSFGTAEDLRVKFIDLGVINVFAASLESNEDNEPVFRASGIYDETKAADPEVGIHNPILTIYNDEDGVYDGVIVPLVLDEETKTFSTVANLSTLTKIEKWYNIKIFLNSDTVTDPDTEEDVFAYDASYEFSTADVQDYTQSVTDNDRELKYAFQNWSDILKINITDISLSIDTLNYVARDGKVFARITGVYAKTGAHFDIFNSEKDPDRVFSSDVIPDEDGNFVCDIDVTDILASEWYDIYLRDADNNKLAEITSDNMPRPISVAADANGYVYSFKNTNYGDTYWWKVCKDGDGAKADQIEFVDANAPILTVSGAINSANSGKDLYIQYTPLDTSSPVSFYSPVTVDENYNFSSTFDASVIVEGTNYELALVSKEDDEYIAITSFYSEYLPDDFRSKTAVTEDGTYKVDSFNGEGGYWTIYIRLN